MKKILLACLVSGVVLSACKKEEASNEVVLNNNMDSVSYAIGVSQAKSLLGQVPDVNTDALMKAYQDVADSSDLMIDDATGQKLLQAFSQELQRKQMEKRQQENEANYGQLREQGIAFLQENATKEGVTVTPSGLQYQMIKEGTGKQPSSTSSVTVHYTGMHVNGEVFESSKQSGQPATFPLNGVIAGWTEGVALMKEGGIIKLFIPQELAYRDQGSGPKIKPFETLIFEIELISVNN